MTPETKLTELSKTIKGAAHNVARQWGVDPDDVEQEIIMGILETFAKTPDFLDQTDSYIVCRGVWAARNHLQRQAKQWNREVETGVRNAQILESAPFVSNYLIDKRATNPWDDVARKLSVDLILSKLNETDRTIVLAIASGFKFKEIAEIVGVSLRTVLNRRHAIKAQAAGLLA